MEGPEFASTFVAGRKAFAGEVTGVAAAAVVVSVVLGTDNTFVTVAVMAGAAVAGSGVAAGTGFAAGGTEVGVGAGGTGAGVGAGGGTTDLPSAVSLISLPWSAPRAEEAR